MVDASVDWSTGPGAEAFRSDVQVALTAFLDQQAVRLAPLGPDADRLLVEARQQVAGGKRLRAAFCYWAHHAVHGEAGGAAYDEALLRACAALEILHASALVHDDLMDDSDTRRGRPAAHKAFEAEHREAGWRGDPVQYGAAAAILLGDLLLSWADELLRHCGLAEAHVEAGLAVLDECRSEVIAGQFLDVSVQARGRADVAAAMTVLRYKSAKYSVERPLHLGAALAGADRSLLGDLTAYGLPLGEAFQLRDDLLGVFGDPEVTGKPAGDDLVEGKRTVLVALALDEAPPQDARLLDASLGTPLTEDRIQQLRDIISACGARQQVEDVIADLTDRALTALERAPLHPGPRDVLRQLAVAATRREV